MKVLVVTPMFPSVGRPEFGIAVAREVDALRRSGVQVRVVDKPRGPVAYFGQLAQLWRALREDGPDVVHAHYGSCGFLAGLIVPRRRLVVTFHGSDLAVGPRPAPDKRWVQYLLGMVACSRARTSIVQSEDMARRIPARLRRRVVLMGQAIDPGDFDGSGERDPGLVVFLGDSRRPGKRFSLAEEAVGRVEAARLTTLDAHPPGEIPDLLSRARVGLLTSRSEGMPIACKEAIAAGLPIVAVDIPAMRELAAMFPEWVRVVPPSAPAIAAEVAAALTRPAPSPADHTRALYLMRQLRWTEPERTRALLADCYPAVTARSAC